MAFVGEYELIEKENYDEYLKIVGVKLLDRKVDRSVMTRIHITNDGENYRYIEIGGLFREFKFQIGQEFQFKYFNSIEVVCKMSLLIDNKLQQSMRDSNGNGINIIRSFSQDGMSEVLDCVDQAVIAKRKFKRS